MSTETLAWALATTFALGWLGASKRRRDAEEWSRKWKDLCQRSTAINKTLVAGIEWRQKIVEMN